MPSKLRRFLTIFIFEASFFSTPSSIELFVVSFSEEISLISLDTMLISFGFSSEVGSSTVSDLSELFSIPFVSFSEKISWIEH